MNYATLMFLIKDHWKWLDTDGAQGEKLSLAGEVLTCIDFSIFNQYVALSSGTPEIQISSVDLRCADFVGAAMDQAKLNGANMQGANFSNANLKESNLIHADLQGTNFSDANLQGSDLTWANLQDTNLEGCNLNQAILNHVGGLTCKQILASRIDSGTFLPRYFEREWRSSDQLECRCVIEPGADLSNWDFRQDDLSTANLQGADMRNCKLLETDLHDANLQDVDFRGTFFHKTNLEGANLSDADLRDTKLRAVMFKGAVLKGANLEGVDLRGVFDLTEEQVASAITNDHTLLREEVVQCPWSRSRREVSNYSPSAKAEMIHALMTCVPKVAAVLQKFQHPIQTVIDQVGDLIADKYEIVKEQITLSRALSDILHIYVASYPLLDALCEYQEEYGKPFLDSRHCVVPIGGILIELHKR